MMRIVELSAETGEVARFASDGRHAGGGAVSSPVGADAFRESREHLSAMAA